VTARGPVPKRLTPIFRDREELASATDLGTVINEALRQSACQIVICSPSAARSLGE
jgi:eukaryotic-like serine/threonine-protein kinase